MKRGFLLMLLLVLSQNLFAQNIFPEEFPRCNTDMFSLEMDTMTALIDETKFLEDLKNHIGEGYKEIRGALMLQIIVELDGSSCLLSIENKTTVTTKKLNLKSWVDEQIKWNKLTEKVSVIIKLDFTKSGVNYTRYGTGKQGWHILK
jgi:hypothetical protein